MKCVARFTTFESPSLRLPNVVKADGSRESFSEDKLRAGMLKALEKRPVKTQEVERSIRKLLQEIRALDAQEIPSSLLGEWVIRELSALDQVAFVRFASVYRQFEDIQAFMDEVERFQRDNPGPGDARQISLLDKPKKP